MIIQAISALKDNYIWAITDNKQQAVIVDPGEAQPVLSFLAQQKLTLAGVLITHHHWDHTNGLAELIEAHPAPVFNASASPKQIIIPNFDYHFTSMPIPGHTLDHTAYYGEGCLFSGDTLFSAGCGRIFEGTPAQMYASLMSLKALPSETKLYCGHEYTLSNLQFAAKVAPSNQAIKQRFEEVQALRERGLPSLPVSLGIEKMTNPFLRCDEVEIKQHAEKYAGELLRDEVAVFAVLRRWKNES